jgi:hypothetical protein
MSSTKKETDTSTNDGDGDTSLSSSLNDGNNNNICRRISMSGTIETSSAGIKLYEASQPQDLQQQQQNHQPFEGIEQFLLYDEDDDDEYDGDESGTSNTMAESSDQSCFAIQPDNGESSSRNMTSEGPSTSKKDKAKTAPSPLEESNTPPVRGSKEKERSHAPRSILKHHHSSNNTHGSPTTSLSRGKASPMVQPGRRSSQNNNNHASSITESLSTTKRSNNTSDLESSGGPNNNERTTTIAANTTTRDRRGGAANANNASSGGPWGGFFKRRRYSTLSNQKPSTDSVVDDGNNDDNDSDDDYYDCDDDDSSSKTSLNHRICRWCYQNEMTVLIVVAIALARVYPPLGAKYLYPHITTTWILLPSILCTSVGWLGREAPCLVPTIEIFVCANSHAHIFVCLKLHDDRPLLLFRVQLRPLFS